MDNRNASKAPVIWLVLFSCGFLLAAGAAVVGTGQWRTMLAESRAPPNGTPGSEQPGTIGLARPHAPMRVP